VAGFAGALFAINTRAVFPDMMLVTRSIELMIMVILGGMFHFWGPAIGAVVLVNLNDIIKARTEYWPLALGLLLAVIVMFLPTGITGIIAERFEKRRGRSASVRAPAVAKDSGGT
jgi:branched-chain amino acid transport system permease protein